VLAKANRPVAHKSKYRPLADYLHAQSGDSCTLSFKDIERIIGSPLPKSARIYVTWWGNDKTHSHSKAWMQAGWRARPFPDSIDPVAFERVEFDIFARTTESLEGKSSTRQVLIRNIDSQVMLRLKERAKRAGRPLERELRMILTKAACPSRAELLEEAKRIQAMSPGTLPDSTETIREFRQQR